MARVFFFQSYDDKSALPHFLGGKEEFSLELSSLAAFLLIGERNAEMNGGEREERGWDG